MASLPDRLGSFDTSSYKSVDLANAYNESLWKGGELEFNHTIFEKTLRKRCRLNTGTQRYPLTDCAHMIFQIRCEFTREDQFAGKMKFRDNEYLVLLDCISLQYKVANFGKLAVEKGWPSYPEYIDHWTYHSGLIALVARNKKLHFFSIDTSLESEPETELELKRVDFTTTYDPTSTQGILSVAINKHYVCISIFDDEHSNPYIEVLDRKTSSTQNILDTRGKLATGILLQKNTLIATFDSATCYWDLEKDVKDPFKIEGPVVNRWYPNVHPTLGTKALNQHISTNEIEKSEGAARLWDRADLSWDISSCAELKESLHNAILDLCNKNNIPSIVYYRIDANCQYLVLSPDTNNTRYQHHWGDDELDFDYSEDGSDISREFYIFDILTTPLKEEEKDLFIKLENDYLDVKGDIEKQATIVQDFGDSRSARVPWLERTGFPSHLVGLKDEEIKSSSQLPRKSEGDEEADVDLVRIIHAAEGVLRDAYALCSDT
ncbi:hypothetical protein V496_00425 [Pseudogymnoascus sp. VKM F-4515 (FW-2607)]|nr:hypothetical protein V496_00425 [Pseudogymnoascus sp. VKM F-4515 (FW-2607)]